MYVLATQVGKLLITQRIRLGSVTLELGCPLQHVPLQVTLTHSPAQERRPRLLGRLRLALPQCSRQLGNRILSAVLHLPQLQLPPRAPLAPSP
jgi:hypothetical protein